MSDSHTAKSDRGLLETQMSVLWTVDGERRLHDARPYVVVGCTRDGELTGAVRSSFDDPLAGLLFDIVDRWVEPPSTQPPRALEECRRLLDPHDTDGLLLSGGPSYLVEPPLEVDVPRTVVRSDSRDAGSVLPLRPDNWQPDEWVDLVNGGAGAPWAMVVEADRVVSICHTPARGSAGAEAGTWTDPQFRGRGCAALTTAAWADVAADEYPYLFYCTSTENRSSQRVAERLGLRHLGGLWKLVAE